MANLTPALAKLNLSLQRHAWPQVSIYLTDEHRGAKLFSTLAGLPRGTWVIFRHYEAAERSALARQVARICRRRRLPLLVAGDHHLARKVGADGVHLPGHLLKRARRITRRPGWIVSAACHNLGDLRRAYVGGVDIALVSPVFATESHPGAASLGVLGLRRFCRHSPLPVIALGGINRLNCRQLAASGAVGIAAITLFEAFADRR